VAEHLAREAVMPLRHLPGCRSGREKVAGMMQCRRDELSVRLEQRSAACSAGRSTIVYRREVR